MTTFPREFIDPIRWKAGSLTLERALVAAPTRGGLQQVAEIGTPMWRARYQSVLLREAQGMAWDAWLASLRGGVRLFKARDPIRRYALTYPSGYGALTRHAGGAFDGTAVLASIGSGRDTGTISTLPSTFALVAGDLFSITSGSIQSLHRVTVAATASAGVIAFACEPSILPGVSTGAAVQLDRPWFKASLDAKSARVEWQAGRRAVVQFEGMQTYA